MTLFAEVALPVPRLDPLTYSVLEDHGIAPGFRVAAPLGRRVMAGVVVRVYEASVAPRRGIKPLIKVLDAAAALPPELLELGQWMGQYYRCTWGEALAAMLPAVMKPISEQEISLALPAPLGQPPRGVAEKILARLVSGPMLKKSLLTDLPKSAVAAFHRLREQGWITVETRLGPQRFSSEATAPVFIPQANLVMSPSQTQALTNICESLDQKKFQTMLLHGVTGSGKTEVYLQAIAHCLSQGRSAIVLVPEIALTPQTQARVWARFGPLVAVLHSGLTPRERADAWSRLQNNQARVALGARSAVFAPVRDLGLIVVDEEPENSYKQEDPPRYHARDVAAMRAQKNHSVLLMGSATPSVETYYKAQSGRFQLLNLPERVDHKQLPAIQIVDLGQAWLKTGRYNLISDELLDALGNNLRQGGQSILFLNRRGFAPVVMCPDCRHVIVCPDCSQAMVYHQTDDCLRCHRCGLRSPARPACPQCGAACVRLRGAGTQRVEEEIKQLLPSARVVRVDLDSTRKRGYLEETFRRFGQGESDILIGTQMVAKGVDFPGVTLVGIISADTGLHLPDFRAEERAFQLIVQVAGRAGRGDKPGLVLVQTLNAKHPVLALAQQHDYAAFFKREIAQRQVLLYPPFSRLANIVCRGQDAEAALGVSEQIAQQLSEAAGPGDSVLGPAPSPHEKIAGQTRYQILIKSRTAGSRGRLLDLLNKVRVRSGVHLSVDVDPMNLL